MASYVDGFVIPIPANKLTEYRSIAKKAGKIWMDHGALQYIECVGDDMEIEGMVPFPRLAKVKAGETVLFSWITYKSRSHRDRVNALVMNDPRMTKMVNSKNMPFDCKRMACGGFKVIVKG